MSDEKDWSIPDAGGIIDIPDRLEGLFNKIGMQIKFHTISDKNEVLTVAHITQHADSFARSQAEKFAEWITQHSYQWYKEISIEVTIRWRPLYSHNIGVTTSELYTQFLLWQEKQ